MAAPFNAFPSAAARSGPGLPWGVLGATRWGPGPHHDQEGYRGGSGGCGCCCQRWAVHHADAGANGAVTAREVSVAEGPTPPVPLPPHLARPAPPARFWGSRLHLNGDRADGQGSEGCPLRAWLLSTFKEFRPRAPEGGHIASCLSLTLHHARFDTAM